MSTGIYKTGIYGVRNACTRVSAQGYACSSFVADSSTGFSGNLGYPMPSNWAFDQFKTDITIGGGEGALGIDKNGFSGRDHGVGSLEESIAIPNNNINYGPSESDTLEGPTIDLFGYKFPLFAANLSLGSPTHNLSSTYDYKTKTLSVTAGYKSDEENNETDKTYGEIKQLLNAMGRETNEAFYKKYKKMKRGLDKYYLKFGFDFSTNYLVYMKYDFKTNPPTLIE